MSPARLETLKLRKMSVTYLCVVARVRPRVAAISFSVFFRKKLREQAPVGRGKRGVADEQAVVEQELAVEPLDPPERLRHELLVLEREAAAPANAVETNSDSASGFTGTRTRCGR